MYKLLLVFFFSVFTVLIAEEVNDKVEIFATNIDTQDNIIEASGDIAVVYKDHFLTASRVIYDKNTGNLELFENVRVNQNGQYKTLGSYARLNIQNKEKEFQPFYMSSEETKVWMSGDKCVEKELEKERVLEISSGIVSSCEPTNPLWKMEFNSSDYNLDTKWVNLYNTKLYIYDIPVFYTPWFGYPMDKTRRTGLLKPTMGYSSDEGALYQQPIYIAEADEWDLEITPQVRSQRGSGIYSTFRFTDSPVSKGELTLGYFKEKDDYFRENNLANQHHRGFDFKYENIDFLNQWFSLDLDGQSGLYADIGYMNDVDYINLAGNNSLNIATATQVLSRINLFYNTDDNYFGTYFKYYQDLTKESNANTIQQLPTLHYHHYLETLFDNHVLYNLDVQSTNIHREEGMKVTQTDVNIPLSIHTSLFDEYVDLTFTTNLYLQHSAFSGDEIRATSTEYENGYIAKNDNQIDISTQLTKAYDDFSHVISFGSSYAFEGAESSNGFYEYNEEYCKIPGNSTGPRCEFYEITDKKRESQVYFSQYIYDNTGSQLIYHRLAQNVIYSNTKTFGDLENELEYQITQSVSLYNNIFYNHDQKKLSKSYSKLSYSDYGFNVDLSHLYSDTFLEARDATPSQSEYNPISSYLTSAIRYKQNSHYSYMFAYDYDIELKVTKRKELGFLYSKRCWDFGIKFVENNRPVLRQNAGITSISNVPEKYIYFTINLRPFMSSVKVALGAKILRLNQKGIAVIGVLLRRTLTKLERIRGQNDSLACMYNKQTQKVQTE